LLNERGKYRISDARWKEIGKRGCKKGSWRVICVLRFSMNSAPHPTTIPSNLVLGDEFLEII
jgi:hypothetical protein